MPHRFDRVGRSVEKLAALAPIALTTTAHRGPISAVVADPAWRRRLEACLREVASIVAAERRPVRRRRRARGLRAARRHAQLMQKDREAGRPLELAIGGPVLRAARRHSLQAPATRELVELIGRAAAAPVV